MFKLEASDQVVIRVPLLPFNFLEDFFSSPNIDIILSNNLVRNAIYIASPSFEAELNKLTSSSLKHRNRISDSLIRYLTRMCTRCTPFGLFAGCFVAGMGSKTKIELTDKITTSTRIDMTFLCKLVDYFKNNPSFRILSTYKKNSSIYLVGDTYRYIEYYYTDNRRAHRLCSVKKNKLLTKVLEASLTGATYKELKELLLHDEIPEANAEAYLEELIDAQILINDIEPSTIGDDPLTILNEKISRMSPFSGERNLIKVSTR